MYIHGLNYKTTTANLLSASTGVQNVSIGLTATSVKSLFARFYETGAPFMQLIQVMGSMTLKCLI